MISLHDVHTPAAGTPVSEWQRRVNNCCDGRVVHALNNLLAGLVAIRYEAECEGWTSTRLAHDRACEAHLRSTLLHRRRERPGFSDYTDAPRPLRPFAPAPARRFA